MDKIIQLTDQRILIIYQLPVYITPSPRYNWKGEKETECACLGIQKTNIRYNLNSTPLREYNITKKFYSLLKKNFKIPFQKSSFGTRDIRPEIKYKESPTDFNHQGKKYSVIEPRSIVYFLSQIEYTNMVAKHRDTKIKNILSD